MPTGYTAQLMESGQDFRSFVLMCARGMGSCIMQRDDPMADPPKKQEPSDFYAKAVAKAQIELARLNAMTTKPQFIYGAELRQKAIDRASESLAKANAENARLGAMVDLVMAWEPPSKDHAGLKEFMLDQIRISRHDDWNNKYLIEATAKSALKFFEQAKRDAIRDIDYYSKEGQKEIDRVNARNKWIDQLYESLP